MKHKLIIVANPKSGNIAKSSLLRQLEKYLDKDKYFYELVYTTHRGHATDIAKRAVENKLYAVVAAGGDGTINEIASALVHTDTALGIIPMGSGNGLSYHLGFKRNIIKAIQCINHHKIIKIDTAKANNKFFINISGMGIDAAVAFKIMNHPNKGFIPYLLTSLKESINFKYFKATISMDGANESGEYAMIVVANGSYYGYNFSITPKAKLTDGMMDVLLVKRVMILRYLPLVWRMLNKTVDQCPWIIYKKATHVTINTEDSSYFQVDGEGFMSEKNIQINIVPKSLNLLINKN